MRKVIDVYLEGDLDRLLRRWSLPDSVVFRRDSPGAATLLLVDEDVACFEGLEAAARDLGDSVRLDPIFWAHSFEREECRAAELLVVHSPVERQIVLQRQPAAGRGPGRSGPLVALAPQPLLGWLAADDSGGHFLHRSVWGRLVREGLASGITATEVSLAVSGQPTSAEWLALAAECDLGCPLDERRFVKTFARGRWSGASFAMTSALPGRPLLVDQRVYRYLERLPRDDRAPVAFEPVELSE